MVYTTFVNYMMALYRDLRKHRGMQQLAVWYPALIGGVAGAWVTASVVEAWKHPASAPPQPPAWANLMPSTMVAHAASLPGFPAAAGHPPQQPQQAPQQQPLEPGRPPAR